MRLIILSSNLILLLMSLTPENKGTFYSQVAKNIESYTKEFDQIREERKKALCRPLGCYHFNRVG